MQLCQGQNYTIKICPKRHASDGKKKNHNWSFTLHFVKVHTHIPCEPVSEKSMLLLSMPVDQNCSQHRNTGVLCCSAWPSGHYFAHWHGLEKQRMMLIEKESFKHNHTPLTDTLSPGKCQVLWMTGHLDWHIQYSASCTWPLCTRWLMIDDSNVSQREGNQAQTFISYLWPQRTRFNSYFLPGADKLD